MNHSPECRSFVAAWETLRTRAYDDGGGVWTIGYGHTRGVRRGDICTPQEAEDWLDEELANVDDEVSALLEVPVSQSEFDALVSLAYNIGVSALAGSTLLKLLNQGQHSQASAQFVRWNKDNGRTLRGLLARRAGELLMFMFGEYSGK